MPYAKVVFGQLGRIAVVLTVALVLAAGMAPKANAQFQFTWTGGNLGTDNLVVSILFNATETGMGTGIYNITGLISGSITDNTPGGENLNATVTGFKTGTFFGRTPRNQFFFPAGGAGSTGASNHYADIDSSLYGGFRIETDLATNPDFHFYAIGANDFVERSPSGNTSSGVIATNSGTHTITQVPGPLAGAGILSWLAVMLMGLAWRWQVKRRDRAATPFGPADKRSDVERQWLLSKTHTCLAVARQRRAQPA